MNAIQIILFLAGTLILVWISRSSLGDLQSHGFYRFFAWEIILIMFVLNASEWLKNPLGVLQIIAWIFLTLSLSMLFFGVREFRKKGKIDPNREGKSLIGIEKTTELVTTGIYKHIRHPFYGSLLFLLYGIFFKHITLATSLLSITGTIFLNMTAKQEERENIEYFGDEYRAYMQETKRFIPFLF